MSDRPTLVTGASGFVGRHLCQRLAEEGMPFIATGRRPEALQERYPDATVRFLDVQRVDSLAPALEGCRAAVYLVHGMAQGGDYERREAQAAMNFLHAAEQAGVERIVYLGGPRPPGEPSKHLRSRLRTGEILRGGSVTTLELQASMIVGDGSLSFQIVRDLAAKLPLMVLPKWLESRSEPIAIDDVTFAISESLTMPQEGSQVLPLPGPEALSGREVLEQTARLFGVEPLTVGVPFVTPELSSHWIRFVTSAQREIAEELVLGLREDLVAPDAGFWLRFPEHSRLTYREAARLALRDSGMLCAEHAAKQGPFRRLGSLLAAAVHGESPPVPGKTPPGDGSVHDG